jgi:hypothetical protein
LRQDGEHRSLAAVQGAELEDQQDSRDFLVLAPVSVS